MIKTSKKILVAFLIALSMLLLVNTKTFADVDKSVVFNEFKEYEYEDKYYTYAGNKYFYPGYFGFTYYLDTAVTFSNDDIAEYVKNENQTGYISAKKEGKTDVTVKVTYKNKTETKKFKLIVSKDYPTSVFTQFKDYKYESSYNLFVGERFEVKPIDVKYNSSINLKFSVKDSSIVEVKKEENSGDYTYYYLKAKKAGSTKITVKVTYDGKTETKSFKINVSKIKDSKTESKTNDIIVFPVLSIYPYL